MFKNFDMTPEKPDKKPPDLKSKQTLSDEEDNNENQWFHESSQTESKALRAMIGKENRPDIRKY
jgi:hypothetical protein